MNPSRFDSGIKLVSGITIELDGTADELAMANKLISSFNELSRRAFKPTYNWQIETNEEFKDRTKGLARATELNRELWNYYLRNAQAYCFATHFKHAELLSASAILANQGSYLASMVALRSAVETAVVFLDFSMRLRKATGDAATCDFTSQVVASDELENFITKAILSSRLPNTPDHLTATNVLTHVNRVSGVDLGLNFDLKHCYEELCEYTHPNFSSRSIFFSDNPIEIEGRRTVVISGKGCFNASQANLFLRTFGWAIAGHGTSVKLVNDSIALIHSKTVAVH